VHPGSPDKIQEGRKMVVCGGHNAVLMQTSPVTEAYASDTQAPSSSVRVKRRAASVRWKPLPAGIALQPFTQQTNLLPPRDVPGNYIRAYPCCRLKQVVEWSTPCKGSTLEDGGWSSPCSHCSVTASKDSMVAACSSLSYHCVTPLRNDRRSRRARLSMHSPQCDLRWHHGGSVHVSWKNTAYHAGCSSMHCNRKPL